jgi:hypothetical protein
VVGSERFDQLFDMVDDFVVDGDASVVSLWHFIPHLSLVYVVCLWFRYNGCRVVKIKTAERGIEDLLKPV